MSSYLDRSAYERDIPADRRFSAIIVVTLAAFFFGLIITDALWQRHAKRQAAQNSVYLENQKKIAIGMTRGQVAILLGEPRMGYPIPFPSYCQPDNPDEMEPGARIDSTRLSYCLVYSADPHDFVVYYDSAGVVLGTRRNKNYSLDINNLW